MQFNVSAMCRKTASMLHGVCSSVPTPDNTSLLSVDEEGSNSLRILVVDVGWEGAGGGPVVDLYHSGGVGRGKQTFRIFAVQILRMQLLTLKPNCINDGGSILRNVQVR